MQRIATTLAGALLSTALAAPALADHIAGNGELKGTVTAPKAFTAAKVFAHKAGTNITYMVFTQGGKYDVVNVMPGTYEIWAQTPDLLAQKNTIEVAADKTAAAEIAMSAVSPVPQAVGPYAFGKERQLVSYDKLYPPGPGRDILQDTCFVCHALNFLPAQPQSREGWGAAVDYMTTSPRWGIKENTPFLSTERLTPEKREILLDYLGKYLGPDQPVRAVLHEEDEPRDEAVLGKAQYIMYELADTPDMQKRLTQETTFDSKGNVWVTEPRAVSAMTLLDPRTGKATIYKTPNPIWAPHGAAIDTDDTVWFGGLKAGLVHLDPKTGNWDTYGKTAETHKDSGGLSPFWDSKGNAYWTDIRFNRIGRLDRKTLTWKYYNTVSSLGSPYGILVDRKDKVWFAEFHGCAIVKFDPETETMQKYPSPSTPCLIRRPGLDSKGNIWYGAYDRGRIEKLDPNTGKITQFQIPVKFATPYDTWVDPNDNVWSSSDNYFVKLEPATGKMSYYPTPQQTDEPKITITREGAIWYTARSARPASAAVLYPDKAKMKTFGAYFSMNDPNANIYKYKGPSIKVAGKDNNGGPGPRPKKPGEDGSNPNLGAAVD